MLPKSLQISCEEMEPMAGIEPTSPSVGRFTLEFPRYLASFDFKNKLLVYRSAPPFQCSVTEGFTEGMASPWNAG